MSAEGEDLLEHLTKKYGPSATQRFGDANSPLRQSGRAVGIEFTNDRKIYNTIRAHTLVEYVKNDLNDNDKANSIMEDLYGRFFVKGQNIDSVELLQQVAQTAGYHVPTEILEDPKRHDQVRQKDMQAKRSGVRGVPFYVIEQNSGGTPVGFSGAMPPAFLAEQLLDVHASGEK
jgi:predicted DsbA family dithiol-disulfide isomerase